MDNTSTSSFFSILHREFPSFAPLTALPFMADVQSVPAFSPGCCSWVFSAENIRTLRFAIGLMGNAASLLLYAVPILTFKRVIERKSSEGFSCIPYITALLNCLIYTWYGLPIVSNEWENLPLVTINCFGILLELSFTVIYLWFASSREKKIVAFIMLPAVIAFCVAVIVLTFALHDHHLRKAMVGSMGLVICIAMYSSPLVVVKQVIETKSVEFMPFFLSFFSFLTSSLWMVYGLLSNDLLLTAPNLLACPLGILQLLLYCIYRKKGGVLEESYKLDLEQNEADLESQQPLLNNSDRSNQN